MRLWFAQQFPFNVEELLMQIVENAYHWHREFISGFEKVFALNLKRLNKLEADGAKDASRMFFLHFWISYCAVWTDLSLSLWVLRYFWDTFQSRKSFGFLQFSESDTGSFFLPCWLQLLYIDRSLESDSFCKPPAERVHNRFRANLRRESEKATRAWRGSGQATFGYPFYGRAGRLARVLDYIVF